MKPVTSRWAVALMVGAVALPFTAQADTTPPTTAPPMSPGMAPPPSIAPLMGMDRLFATRAAEGNLAEVTISRLALDKSRNPQVRAVAERLIREHGAAQTELLGIARSKGAPLPQRLSVGHTATYQALMKANRADFDKMYMAVQVDDHENTVALMQSQIANGNEPALRDYAARQLPGILMHTEQIYSVARQVGAPGMDLRPMTPPMPPGTTTPSQTGTSQTGTNQPLESGPETVAPPGQVTPPEPGDTAPPKAGTTEPPGDADN